MLNHKFEIDFFERKEGFTLVQLVFSHTPPLVSLYYVYYFSAMLAVTPLCLLCLYYAYYACATSTIPIYNHTFKYTSIVMAK